VPTPLPQLSLPAPTPTRLRPNLVRRLAKRLRSRINSVRTALRYEVHAYWRARPVLENVVLYESFAGNGMLCNPEAIFRHLRDLPEFAHLTHVWALSSKRENRHIVHEFSRDRSVKFVKPRSFAYFKALATSAYLINNATFPPEFGKREGQLYLNTWHGTPLKRMGYDIGDPASRVGNVIRNFLNADFLLSASPYMTERLYESAHMLRGIYRGTIIEEGYPRIDRQFVDQGSRVDIRSLLDARNLPIGDRRVILYAPTWKGTSFNKPEDDIEELAVRVAEIESRIDTGRYVVLLKTHQVVHKYAHSVPRLRGKLVPNEIPTNQLLAATDILITDYSSIFFDFLATGRPILFLTPDIVDYSDYRGLYIDPSDLPGIVCESVDRLGDELALLDRAGESGEIAQRYKAARSRFVPYEDGGATERVVDIVFRGNTEGYRLVGHQENARTSVLINGGSMRPNGITASLLNLLEAIDYDKFDVSLIFPNYRRKANILKQQEVNSHVRKFARVGGMNGSKVLQLVRRRSLTKGDLSVHRRDPAQRRMWDDEWKRCFGDSHFDYVVDFSGYGSFFSTLMLHAPDATRSIWLHNDLAADAHRAVHGKRRLLRDLRGIFGLYSDYDHLVSVSPALSRINTEGLHEYAPYGKFSEARNLINSRLTLAAAEADVRLASADLETGEVPDWADRLANGTGHPVFVTVGRLSPEKNHVRLIRALALLRVDVPDAELMIVGAGPLRETLERLVERLGLQDAVTFTGHQSNPHAIMAHCDCFVLSSDYEGQPMVLLEAMVLGLPIVTVAFGSAADALPSGVGLVTEMNEKDLAGGMLEFVRGKVPTGVFDADLYNVAAMKEFVRAIGADSESTPSARRAI
jgi:CDP-glycerol glycerophosphotransferase